MFAISLFISLVIISKVNECSAQFPIQAIIKPTLFGLAFVKDIREHLRIIGKCIPEDLLMKILESPEFDLLDELQLLELDNMEETLSNVINNTNSLLLESQKCFNQNRQVSFTCLFNIAMRAIENISNLLKKYFPSEVSLSEMYTKVINIVMLIIDSKRLMDVQLHLKFRLLSNPRLLWNLLRICYELLRIIGQCKIKDLLTKTKERPEFNLLEQIQLLELNKLEETLSNVIINNINSLVSKSEECLKQNPSLLVDCVFYTYIYFFLRATLAMKYFPKEVNQIFTKITNVITSTMLIDVGNC